LDDAVRAQFLDDAIRPKLLNDALEARGFNVVLEAHELDERVQVQLRPFAPLLRHVVQLLNEVRVPVRNSAVWRSQPSRRWSPRFRTNVLALHVALPMSRRRGSGPVP